MLGISPMHLAAFLLTAFVVIVIPGPSVLFVVSRALATGRRVAILSVLGNTVGEYLQVIAVAFGVGALAERSIEAFTVMKLVGGAYLIYLGWKTFRERRKLRPLLDIEAPPHGTRRSFLEGVMVGGSNPKTIIFLSAILPQFVTPSAEHIPNQILFLGLLFSMIAVVSDTCWALAAGWLRTWLARSPQRLEWVGGTGGIAIMAVGAGLILSGRKS